MAGLYSCLDVVVEAQGGPDVTKRGDGLPWIGDCEGDNWATKLY